MSSWWDWWWNTRSGGFSEGVETGKKAVEGVGDALDAGGAMSAIGDTVNFSKAVWLNVSDYRMWRSLGWLLLGILLMVIGFMVWNRKALESAAKLAAL